MPQYVDNTQQNDEDTLWNGIETNIKSFYEERIRHFANANNS